MVPGSADITRNNMMEGKQFENWMREVETVRSAIDAMVGKLLEYGAVSAEPDLNEFGRLPSGELPYAVQFNQDNATTTIRIVLRDHNAPTSDLVITNMTTLPDAEKGKGYGSQAIEALLRWAKDNGMKEIRATQVSDPQSSNFWQKNGFTKTGNQFGDHVKMLG